MCLILITIIVLILFILTALVIFSKKPSILGGRQRKKIDSGKSINNKMSFPYVHKTLADPKIMFEKLKKSPLVVKNGVLFRTYPGDYLECDRVADHYTEELRMRAVFLPGKKVSPYDYWLKHKNADYEEIYNNSGVANGFNPAIAKYLCEKFKATTVFDPCMGWGDRLVGCMTSVNVKKYVGYDTNTALEEKYRKIAELSPIELELNMQPIEAGDFKYAGANFDIVITSPPFFTIEIYEGDLTSTNLYKTETEWYEVFYRELIKRCVDAIKHGGHICLYIAPQMLEYSKKFAVEFGATYEGIVGFYQDTGKGFDKKKVRNTYIFKRI